MGEARNTTDSHPDSESTLSSSLLPPKQSQPKENVFKNLPTEIILRILLHLSPHELVQSASCCREWYFIVSDPILWRTLDLSLLHSELFNPKTASALTSRLQECRNFTLKEPLNLTTEHITALLHFLAASPRLESLCLRSIAALNPHSLEHHFRVSQSTSLMHIDLSHTPVTTPAVVAMMNKHKDTLQTLDLSYTAIGDGTLRSVSQAKSLHTLDISSCTSISRTSIRNFLCKRFPACLVELSLRGLKEVKITWLHDLLKLPSSANLKVLNVEGCERLTLGDLKDLQSVCERVEIRHNAREENDSVWGYRRYIEFLGTDPSLPERLGEDGMVVGGKKYVPPDKQKEKAWQDALSGKPGSSRDSGCGREPAAVGDPSTGRSAFKAQSSSSPDPSSSKPSAKELQAC